MCQAIYIFKVAIRGDDKRVEPNWLNMYEASRPWGCKRGCCAEALCFVRWLRFLGLVDKVMAEIRAVKKRDAEEAARKLREAAAAARKA